MIPHFDSWRSDRRDLWRRGLTLLGRFVHDADGIVLLLSPSLPSLRDQAQVQAMTRWLAELDSANQLRQLFMAPDHLSAAALTTCIEEEGWMLGAGVLQR